MKDKKRAEYRLSEKSKELLAVKPMAIIERNDNDLYSFVKNAIRASERGYIVCKGCTYKNFSCNACETCKGIQRQQKEVTSNDK